MDNRSEARSNVFLAATLNFASAAIAVRIRNLSPRGALVEAASLPPVGSPVTLVRGHLRAGGEIAWAGAGQGGLNFAQTIDVEGWVKRVGHAGQQNVDAALSALRGTGKMPAHLRGQPVLDSLADISAALDRLCDELAVTPNMSIEVGEKLVKLDGIAEALRRRATGKSF